MHIEQKSIDKILPEYHTVNHDTPKAVSDF